jgi:hypothetical protein
MSYIFDYLHDSFDKTAEIVPIFKYPDNRLLLIEAKLFRRILGESPGFIILHTFEPTFEGSRLLHNYLAEKKGLENTVFRIPRSLLTNSAGMLLHSDSILEVMEDCKGLEIADPLMAMKDLFW